MQPLWGGRSAWRGAARLPLFQRIESQGRMGANPFMLALSLYLDIFNLFLFILRFMTALSGNRR